MQNLDNLLNVCTLYKQGRFGIEEFQSRVATAAIPENLSKEFLKSLENFDNEIERIVFCFDPKTREIQGFEVADKLMQEVFEEQQKI